MPHLLTCQPKQDLFCNFEMGELVRKELGLFKRACSELILRGACGAYCHTAAMLRFADCPGQGQIRKDALEVNNP
jgi:hypothetical protein